MNSTINGAGELLPFFKALGEETRINALAMLTWYEELCVCDFIAALEITQSKASRHLRYMQNAGLLSSRRHGTWMYYRINSGLPESQRAMMNALRELTAGPAFSDLKKRLELWLTREDTDCGCPV